MICHGASQTLLLEFLALAWFLGFGKGHVGIPGYWPVQPSTTHVTRFIFCTENSKIIPYSYGCKPIVSFPPQEETRLAIVSVPESDYSKKHKNNVPQQFNRNFGEISNHFLRSNSHNKNPIRIHLSPTSRHIAPHRATLHPIA